MAPPPRNLVAGGGHVHVVRGRNQLGWRWASRTQRYSMRFGRFRACEASTRFKRRVRGAGRTGGPPRSSTTRRKRPRARRSASTRRIEPRKVPVRAWVAVSCRGSRRSRAASRRAVAVAGRPAPSVTCVEMSDALVDPPSRAGWRWMYGSVPTVSESPTTSSVAAPRHAARPSPKAMVIDTIATPSTGASRNRAVRACACTRASRSARMSPCVWVRRPPHALHVVRRGEALVVAESRPRSLIP